VTLGAWLVARGRWVVGAVVLTSLGFGLAGLGLRLEFRYADLLPQRHPFIQVHERFHRNFSEANVLTVMVEAREGTIFTPAILSTIFRVTEAVDRLPGVNHDQVTSIAHRSTRWARVRAGGVIASEPIMLREPKTAAEALEIRREALQSYAFGTMVSLDERAAVVRAGFHEHRLDYRRLFEAVDTTVLGLADERADVLVAGQPRLNGWVFRLEGEVLRALVLALLVTWVCLHLYFRDWRGALRPTISGGLAALWGFGLMRLTGFALNPLTLFIPFLITARAVSHSAQMHDRYYEELARGEEKEAAIQQSFRGLFAATMAAILTDALGLLAIGIVAIPALQALAVASTLWLTSLIATELFLNPVVYSFLRAPDPAAIIRRERGWLTRASARAATALVGRRGRWTALGACALTVGVAAALLPSMQVGDPGSGSRILAADSEYNRSHHAVQERFGGSEPFMVVVEGDHRDALQELGVLDTIERFQRALERNPIVGASFSLVDILKSMGQLFHELEPKWAVIPRDDASIRTMFFTYWGTVFPSTSAQYFTPDFRIAHVTFYCRDHGAESVRNLVRDARAFIEAHPLPHVRFLLAGGYIGVLAAIYDEILRSDALMTMASFAAMFVIVAATYRSVVAALLLLVPLGVANAVVNAYMAARGIGLDLNTLPVIAVGVGFGIDYGIYVLSRMQEAVGAGASLEEATRGALAGAGRTVAFTALAMTASILCFTWTELRFVSEMAVLLAIWMLTSAAASLGVLPALALVLRPRFLRGPTPQGAGDSGAGTAASAGRAASRATRMLRP
jgi:predicted RND superfamily exporter protein